MGAAVNEEQVSLRKMVSNIIFHSVFLFVWIE